MFCTDAFAVPSDHEVMEDSAVDDTPGGFLCIPDTIAKAPSCLLFIQKETYLTKLLANNVQHVFCAKHSKVKYVQNIPTVLQRMPSAHISFIYPHTFQTWYVRSLRFSI